MDNASCPTSAAGHWCWVTAHLYGKQISIGVIAVTQACCQPVWKISIEQCGVHFAKISFAVHWWWVTAHLYEDQIFIGVIAVTPGCCQQSSTAQWGMHFGKTSAAVPCS